MYLGVCVSACVHALKKVKDIYYNNNITEGCLHCVYCYALQVSCPGERLSGCQVLNSLACTIVIVCTCTPKQFEIVMKEQWIL